MPVGQLAPAGTALRSREILGWLAATPACAEAAERLRQAFLDRYPVRHAFLLSSGRAAMFLILRALSRIAGPKKYEVIVPAYTCYTVAATAVRAGLRVRICDIDPHTLSYNLNELAGQDFTNVLAIVTGNLYGIPNDLPAIESLARRNGVYLLDDAAQSLDARIGGRAAGTFGDVGLFSFDKGKNITSLQGGVIVTNSDPLATELQRAVSELPAPPASRTLLQAVQLLIYAAFLRPWLYAIPASLPFLKLGETVYTTEYPIERYSRFLAPLVAAQFERIESIGAGRLTTALRIQDAFAGLSGIHPVRLLPTAQPVYPRMPLLIESAGNRTRLLQALQRERLGATGSYPLCLADVPELRPHLAPTSSPVAGGRRVAASVVTLPTHQYVSPEHIARMVSVAHDALHPSSTPP